MAVSDARPVKLAMASVLLVLGSGRAHRLRRLLPVPHVRSLTKESLREIAPESAGLIPHRVHARLHDIDGLTRSGIDNGQCCFHALTPTKSGPAVHGI